MNTREERLIANITPTQQGIRASKDREVLNLKFSSSHEVQWLKSLPAYDREPLAVILWKTEPS